MALISSSSHTGYNNDKQFGSSFSKKVMTLPRIQHPSKLVNNEDQSLLDIRGRSRDGHGNGQLIRSETSTPDVSHRRRRSSSLQHYSNSTTHSQPLTQIPENVNAVYGEDRDKVRLPIFGN